MLQTLKNLFWHLPKNIYFNLIFGFPSSRLILIGITGTDGKTTTCSLVHQVLTNSGIKAGLISTINAKIGDTEINTGLHTTSPDPQDVQRLFAQMVKAKITHVVCEITSHALDQNRFLGCNFEVAAITNTSHEHLDYHHTMENYIRAKTKLFFLSKTAILNKDDPSFDQISQVVKKPIVTYGIKNRSDLQAKNITKTTNSLQFSADNFIFKTDSVYEYQIYNILAAYGICKKLKIDPQIFLKTIKKFPHTPGRREEIKNNLGIRAVVDFAHTPAALTATLKSLRTPQGRLIVIFGATGGRDPSKRPIMGKVVSQNSDIAIITADDTRNERVEDINDQIIAGIKENKKFIYHNIKNRQDAFNLAVKLSRPGDTVIACGKGHETTILHGKTEYPWSEADAFRTAFRKISN